MSTYRAFIAAGLTVLGLTGAMLTTFLYKSTPVQTPPQLEEKKWPACVPRYKPGDRIQTVMPDKSTDEKKESFEGQVAIFEGTGTENGVCVYTVIHYGRDGETSRYKYWEFELKPYGSP